MVAEGVRAECGEILPDQAPGRSVAAVGAK
jgi:hypothetical protein